METENIVRVERFCMFHRVEPSFLHELESLGLVDILHEEGEEYIEASALSLLEKWVRLHRDLDINLGGLGAVAHLLEKLSNLQEENRLLRNKLRCYQ